MLLPLVASMAMKNRVFSGINLKPSRFVAKWTGRGAYIKAVPWMMTIHFEIFFFFFLLMT
jgi:hypothetical protein